MFEDLTIFVSGITGIFGIFGLYLFLRFLTIWRKTSPDIIRERVSRAGGFIMKNILIIFIAGLLIVYHNFMEFLGLGQPDFYYNYLSVRYPTRLIAVTELFLALVLIEWLMYEWIEITKK
jgi:hypothetical protein